MGQMKSFGPRSHIAVARPVSDSLTEARMRAIAREEVDAVLDEMAQQALAAMGHCDG